MDANPPRDASMIHCRRGGLDWHVTPDGETLLPPSGEWSLANWLATQRARAVKKGQRRAVFAVELDGRVFFVQHDRQISLLRAVANLFRGSSARRKWRSATEASRRGVATARPVAWAERRRGGLVWESLFATEAIDDAVALDRFVEESLAALAEPQRRLARRRLVERLAMCVAALHEAGVAHNDFHAGNMLVRATGAAGPMAPEIYLIDLEHVRFSRALDWPSSRNMLVVLHAEWFRRSSVAERWRFWRTYLAARPGLVVPDRDTVVRQLDWGAREHSRRIDRGRDRRAMRTNRDFQLIHDHRGELHAVADLPPAAAETLLDQPEQLMQEYLHRPVKISHSSVVVRAVLALDSGPVGVAYKRYRPRSVWKSICGRFRRSGAVRAWRLGHAMLTRGVDAARPLAVCQPRRTPRRGESYLATEWIEGSENLHLWAWRSSALETSQRLRLAALCAVSLGRLLGTMHAARISHRDLKGSNVLVSGCGQTVRTWLIDADGVRIHRRLAARRRAADLARLAASVEAHSWVTRSIRYRFLQAYALQFPRGEVDCRALWRAVAVRAGRIVGRKRRQGKPLL